MYEPGDGPGTPALGRHRSAGGYRRVVGVHRAPGAGGPTRGYLLTVALLAGTASMPILAAISAGSATPGSTALPDSSTPFIPTPSVGPVVIPLPMTSQPPLPPLGTPSVGPTSGWLPAGPRVHCKGPPPPIPGPARGRPPRRWHRNPRGAPRRPYRRPSFRRRRRPRPDRPAGPGPDRPADPTDRPPDPDPTDPAGPTDPTDRPGPDRHGRPRSDPDPDGGPDAHTGPDAGPTPTPTDDATATAVPTSTRSVPAPTPTPPAVADPPAQPGDPVAVGRRLDAQRQPGSAGRTDAPAGSPTVR